MIINVAASNESLMGSVGPLSVGSHGQVLETLSWLSWPSEGIPLAAHHTPQGCQVPVLTVAKDCVTLTFPFRKNRLWPGDVGAAVARVPALYTSLVPS